MKTLTVIIASVVALSLIVSCAQRDRALLPTQDSDPQLLPARPAASDQGNQEVVMPDNPDGSYWYEMRSGLMEWHISMAVCQSRDLKGCEFPETYEEILSSGLLPMIYHNRYTGEPIKSTPEYSAGDIYYKADRESGMYYFYRYQGPQDQVYDPDATGGKDLPWEGSPRDTVTDGESIKTVADWGPEGMAGSVPAAKFREDWNMPASDDSRVAVFIVYYWVNDVMYRLGEIVDQVPSTLDEYVEMLGERNPVAWTNPYSGEPMHAVGWYDVPLYYGWEPLTDSIKGIDIADPAPPDGVIGNYSYMIAPSPVVEGENRSYAKFYFKEPDGSVAAYLAIGVGPQEFLKGGIDLGPS